MILLGRAEMQTDPRSALDNVLSGLELRKKTGALLALPLHQSLVAEVRLAEGAIDEAKLAISAGLRVARRTGELWWLPELYRLSAVIDYRAGRSDVESLLRLAHGAAKEAGVAMLAARAALTAGELLAGLGPEDPLHLSHHQHLIDGNTPEAAELRRRLS
jgi:hypothetical protein